MASRRHSIPILSLCTLLAVVLWAYVSLSRINEDDLLMPLVVLAPANQALLSTVPKYVTVRVRGTGLQILNLQYVHRSSACTLDLSRMRPLRDMVYDVTRDEMVRSIVTPQAVRTVSVQPSHMTLTIGDLAVKHVPVRVRTSISPRDGFMLVGEPTVSPMNVEVRGSGAILRDISNWPTSRFTRADAYQSVDADVGMSDSMSSQLNIVPSTVRLRANIQQIAQISIADVPVTIAGNGNSRHIAVSPSRIQVVVRGGVDQLSRLTSADFRAEVDPRPDGTYQKARITAPGNVAIIGNSYVRIVERTSSELSP